MQQTTDARVTCYQHKLVISTPMNMHKRIGIANHKPDSALNKLNQYF